MADNSTRLYTFIRIVTGLIVVALCCLTVGLTLLTWLSLGGV